MVVFKQRVYRTAALFGLSFNDYGQSVINIFSLNNVRSNCLKGSKSV